MKITNLAILLLVPFLITGCGLTPEEKEAQIYEESGFNACMARIEQAEQKHSACVSTKLSEQGYTNNIDCVMDCDDYPEDVDGDFVWKEGQEDCVVCTTDRYNAGANANNDCYDELDDPTLPTYEGCLDQVSDWLGIDNKQKQ